MGKVAESLKKAETLVVADIDALGQQMVLLGPRENALLFKINILII
jgi:hypothetical protein